jgi:hypothetical protein
VSSPDTAIYDSAAGYSDPVFNRSHAAIAPVATIMIVKQSKATHFGAELL